LLDVEEEFWPSRKSVSRPSAAITTMTEARNVAVSRRP